MIRMGRRTGKTDLARLAWERYVRRMMAIGPSIRDMSEHHERLMRAWSGPLRSASVTRVSEPPEPRWRRCWQAELDRVRRLL